MNIQPLKIFVVILSLLFLSSCAVFVRDEDWDHHHYYHNHEYRHHSSLQQSETQMTAQDNGDSGGQGQVGR